MATEFNPPSGPTPIDVVGRNSHRLAGIALLALGVLLAVVSMIALISGRPTG